MHGTLVPRIGWILILQMMELIDAAIQNYARGRVVGAAPLVAIQSASAAPLMADHTTGKIGTNVETVQYRHHGVRYHGGGSRHNGHGYNGRHGRYGGGYYRNGPAVLGGLAAGAIVGGAIANSQARADSDGYCSQRYRSYEPASGTYLGYDGQRHSCP